MNIDDKINVPGIIQTRGDALAVLCKYRLGVVVYQANFTNGSITQQCIREIQFIVSMDGKAKVRYLCTNPARRQDSGTWHDDENTLYPSLEAAASAIWTVPDSKM